jgi:hypothetical protein
MNLAVLHFISQSQQSGQPVVITSWMELLTLIVLISALAAIYKHFECHEEGCHRHGKYPHGHIKLCSKHHPLITGDSKKDISLAGK